jgi:hypothetical protein
MLLPLLILASLGYVAFAVSVVLREKRGDDVREADSAHPLMKFVLASGAPLVTTVTMAYLFLIAGGSTTVQLNAGSPAGMNVWSTWVGLWPVFLLITAASGFGSMVWLGLCAFKKRMRASIPVSVASLMLSVFAFFTVISYFPSA